MKAAVPVSGWTTAVGLSVMKVEVYDVVTATGIAWVRNDKNQNFEVPYRVQRSKGRIPRIGELWYVDRTLGPWTFAAYISKSDKEFTTHEEKTTFSDGVEVAAGKQINVGSSTSDASFASVREADAQAAISIRKTGDILDRVYIRTDGAIWLGSGAIAPDTNLYRSAANTLKTDDSLIVGTNLTIGTDVVNTAWTAYTPTWTGSTTNPALGNGTVSAAYKRIGKTVFFRIHYTFGSTTNFGGGAYAWTLPVTAIEDSAGSIVCVDSSAAQRWPGSAWISGTVITRALAGAGGHAGISSSIPFTWDTGDELILGGCYEST